MKDFLITCNKISGPKDKTVKWAGTSGVVDIITDIKDGIGEFG